MFAGSDLGFCTSTLKSFILLALSPHLSLNSHIPGENILLLAQSRDRMEFRGPGLTPSAHHLPRCLLEPVRGLLKAKRGPTGGGFDMLVGDRDYLLENRKVGSIYHIFVSCF